MSSSIFASALAVTLFGAGTPAVLRGQGGSAPKVLYACYVPSAGTVYRIKEPGLQQSCAIQALERRTREIAALRRENAELRERLERREAAVVRLTGGSR